jgi:hypothetical protein
MSGWRKRTVYELIEANGLTLHGDIEHFAELVREDALAQPALVREPWKSSDTAYRPGGMPQDFIKHEVENEGDWSEWVNPNSDQYFMKCCDCGLVHEMQFKVAKYSEGDDCEFVADANLQNVFRARRATPPAQPEQEPVAWKNAAIRLGEELSSVGPDGYYNMTAEQWLDWAMNQQPRGKNSLPQPQRQWVGLTDEEILEVARNHYTPHQRAEISFVQAIEATLKERNT